MTTPGCDHAKPHRPSQPRPSCAASTLPAWAEAAAYRRRIGISTAPLARSGGGAVQGCAMNEPRNTPQSRLSMDPFAPGDIARRLEAANVSRASLPARRLLLLGLVGGVYISFGGALATLVLTDNILGYGLGRLVAGLAFSLGLIMLVVAGGELFTGNNLMVLALAGRKITFGAMLRNWVRRLSGQCRRRRPPRVCHPLLRRARRQRRQGDRRQDRRGQGAARSPDGLPARRPVQHAGVPGGVAERGRPQRRGQGRSPSPFRSAPSWRSASSTASPTSTC